MEGVDRPSPFRNGMLSYSRTPTLFAQPRMPGHDVTCPGFGVTMEDERHPERTGQFGGNLASKAKTEGHALRDGPHMHICIALSDRQQQVLEVVAVKP